MALEHPGVETTSAPRLSIDRSSSGPSARERPRVPRLEGSSEVVGSDTYEVFHSDEDSVALERHRRTFSHIFSQRRNSCYIPWRFAVPLGKRCPLGHRQAILMQLELNDGSEKGVDSQVSREGQGSEAQRY